MSQAVEFPGAVYAVWWTMIIVTLVVLVPLAVHLLRRTWLAARSIEIYARESLTAAAGIVDNTSHIGALEGTIGVAGEMLDTAGNVVQKLDTIATVLDDRAGRI